MSYNFCHNQQDNVKVISYSDFENIVKCASYGGAVLTGMENKPELWPGPELTYYSDYHRGETIRFANTNTLASYLRAGIEVLNTGKMDEGLSEHFYTDLTVSSEIRREITQLAEVFIQVCEVAPNSLEVNYFPVGSESLGNEISLALCTWNENTHLEYLRIRSFGWRVIQLLAKMHGWVPQGTNAPKPSVWLREVKDLSTMDKYWLKRLTRYDWRLYQEDNVNAKWSGGYYLRMWQEVSAEDAHNLAHALLKAIVDITRGLRNVDIIEYMIGDEDLVKCVEEDNGPEMPVVSDPAEFRRQTIELCEGFIKFCDGVAFLIS